MPGESEERIASRGFYGSGIRHRSAAMRDVRRRFGSRPDEEPVRREGARFYVTARSGHRTAFLLGPYSSHMTAQGKVSTARRLLRERGYDDSFASIGTASVGEAPFPETVLGR